MQELQLFYLDFLATLLLGTKHFSTCDNLTLSSILSTCGLESASLANNGCYPCLQTSPTGGAGSFPRYIHLYSRAVCALKEQCQLTAQNGNRRPESPHSRESIYPRQLPRQRHPGAQRPRGGEGHQARSGRCLDTAAEHRAGPERGRSLPYVLHNSFSI